MNIRTYQPGDEAKILALDARVLPSEWNPRTPDNWRWKFTAQNPAGPALIRVVEMDGDIIAHFAAVPYRLRVFGEEVTASHTIGALVDEAYQNKGLLKLVADKLWEDLAARDISLTWGFPNTRAYALHRLFLGYKDLATMNSWTLEKPQTDKKPLPESFRPIESFGEEFDRFWKNCRKGFNIAVLRDGAYLQWRYKERPDWVYHSFGVYQKNSVRGYVVLKLYREENILRGHIIDVFAYPDDEETISQLLRGSLDYFSRNSVDEVTTWISGSPLVEGLLEAHHFRREDGGRPLVLRLNRPLEGVPVFDGANWYFTMGDSTEIF